jgi:hypothetical protein
VGIDGTRTYDAHATVANGVDLARRTYARLDPAGDDGLGRARTVAHGGGASWFNRITRTASIGVGGAAATVPNGRLVTLETTVHELTHKWMDSRAGFGGLLYAGPSGRLSEGLSQVMAGAALTLEGTSDAERAWGWKVLDPRGQTTPIGGTDVPLSVTMDDVARRGFTLTDNGLVHVHSGVVQEGHLQLARAIGMEPMAQLTVDTARAELTPVMGVRGWADAMLRTAEKTWGAGSTEHLAVRDAWRAARVLLPG